MNDIDKFRALVFDAPDDMQLWSDNSVMPVAARRRVQKVIDNWRTELGQEHVEYLNARSAQIKIEYKVNTRKITEFQRDAAEVNRLMAAGRLPSDEGTKRLTRIENDRQEALKIQASLHRAVEAWEVEADRDPVDRLREQQDRFSTGVPAYGKRNLTPAILDGDA